MAYQVPLLLKELVQDRAHGVRCALVLTTIVFEEKVAYTQHSISRGGSAVPHSLASAEGCPTLI